MTPSQRKYLLMVRDDINRRLDEEPGYFELARRLIKQMATIGTKITTCDVPEDECVGIRILYPDPTKVHQFWINPKLAKAEIWAVRFHGNRLELAIHFNDE